jgi:hypothetical protein
MKHLKLLLSSIVLLTASLASAADISITASSFLPSSAALYANGLCGEAVTTGQLVHESTADGRYYLADANVATKWKVAGIAGHATTAAGQPLSIIYFDPALTVGATLSTTAPVYVLSATAGGIAPSADIAAGWYPVVVGVSISTTKMYFNPRRIQGSVPATASIDGGDDTWRIALVPPPVFRALPSRIKHPASSVNDLALAA